MPPPIIAMFIGFWVEEEREEDVVAPDLDSEAVEVPIDVLEAELYPPRPFRWLIFRSCSMKF